MLRQSNPMLAAEKEDKRDVASSNGAILDMMAVYVV
jgi:hypothetical protein